MDTIVHLCTRKFEQWGVSLQKETVFFKEHLGHRGTWIVNRGCSLIKGIWTVVMAPARDNDTRQNTTKCFYNRPVSACGQTRRARQDQHMDHLVTAALKKKPDVSAPPKMYTKSPGYQIIRHGAIQSQCQHISHTSCVLQCCCSGH